MNFALKRHIKWKKIMALQNDATKLEKKLSLSFILSNTFRCQHPSDDNFVITELQSSEPDHFKGFF